MNILAELKTESNGTYREMYTLFFEDVKRFIMARNGSAEDAEDVFQDTLIILVEKLRRDHFVLTASLKTYIIAIAKYLWFRKCRQTGKHAASLQHVTDTLYADVTAAVENERTYWEKIKAAMTKVTGHCNRLLHDMFFKNKPGSIIQKEYGYSSLHNMQNQKYKCINQIRKALEEEKKIEDQG